MDLKGKTAVVTGGASGIGRAIAANVVARGGRVLIADINAEQAAGAARELGPLAAPAVCDVADHAQVLALAKTAERELGAVDLVFANAGVSFSTPLIDATPEAFDWVYGINLRGIWSTVSVFAKSMIAAGRDGRICITASEHAFGLQHSGAGFYTASKHGALGLAEVFRAELPKSISISVLCPGLAATSMHVSGLRAPGTPAGQAPSEIAAAVLGKGMSAEPIGKAAVEGTLRGDFLIVTHAISVKAAQARWKEIESAFATQAPWEPGAERYDVNNVIGQVLAEMQQEERG
jgi:NAD(P)-dependent dehydrogenase (short-subunit alcohol dehydrogenase family)